MRLGGAFCTPSVWRCTSKSWLCTSRKPSARSGASLRVQGVLCTSGAWRCTCKTPSARSGDYLHVQGGFCTVRPSPLDVQRALCTVKPALLDVQRTLRTSAPRWGANLCTYIGPMALKSSILTASAACCRNDPKLFPNHPF